MKRFSFIGTSLSGSYKVTFSKLFQLSFSHLLQLYKGIDKTTKKIAM